jgi:hypothetical protein
MLLRTWDVIKGVAQPKNRPGEPQAWMATKCAVGGVLELVADHHREWAVDLQDDEPVVLRVTGAGASAS